MSTKAYSYIIKLLSARDYSEFKLREKLKQKNFPANEIENALNEVKVRGYLREEVYNEARIRSFMNKSYSPSYIKQRLNQEHIDVNVEQIEDFFKDQDVNTQKQIELLVRKKCVENLNVAMKNKIKYFVILFLKVMTLKNLKRF